MFPSLLKSLKTRSKPILKNVVVRWYGEITLKILKEKPIKFIKVKAHSNLSIMYPLGIKSLTDEKNIHFKKTFKNKVQFG
jgi:Holliday junction resolvase-like predicted endonuclease